MGFVNPSVSRIRLQAIRKGILNSQCAVTHPSTSLGEKNRPEGNHIIIRMIMSIV